MPLVHLKGSNAPPDDPGLPRATRVNVDVSAVITTALPGYCKEEAW